ncbi:MAG: DEAD/DEAH box helicase [Cyclobacteriaceae bacterium]|nr:DEAD/DEAH box helicase [Cyclobacteriaceae bacterium]
MADVIKSQEEILKKLGIEKLNPMQEEALACIAENAHTVLLSPTGTGKTLAFLLPIFASLDAECTEIQAMILVPSRELALQIEQVARNMGTGFKINAVYGGRAGTKDKADLKHRPAILIGTPGRIADRLRRDDIETKFIQTLVLDEFDKSLEVGFEAEMMEIVNTLTKVKKRILTSATQKSKIPPFVRLQNPVEINYLSKKTIQLSLRTILATSRDKKETLVTALGQLNNQPGIIFCNLKETIGELSEYLTRHKISHGCFHGGMEQSDRERALIKFRNGTHQLLIASDLAARGIDVPEIRFILHYELPPRPDEFTHRNGRTARMNQHGTAYVLVGKQDLLPAFIGNPKSLDLRKTVPPAPSPWQTIYVTGGRKDKISKGDIAGFFLKQGRLSPDQLGVIEIKQDCAYVAVHSAQASPLIKLTNNTRLKNKKVRVSII